jgi:hypothetical protein
MFKHIAILVPAVAKSFHANAKRNMTMNNDTKKNTERTTACIRNSGFSAKSKVIAFNKIKCQTESEVLFNPLLLIHAKR